MIEKLHGFGLDSSLPSYWYSYSTLTANFVCAFVVIPKIWPNTSGTKVQKLVGFLNVKDQIGTSSFRNLVQFKFSSFWKMSCLYIEKGKVMFRKPYLEKENTNKRGMKLEITDKKCS